MLKLKFEGEVIKETVQKIIDDLSGRKGLGDEWEQIDEEIQEEIKSEWESIILELVSGYTPKL